MSVLQRLRILPMLVLVAGFALIVRVGEFAAGIEQAGVAFAQQEVSVEPPPMPSEDSDTADENQEKMNEDVPVEGEEPEVVESTDESMPSMPAEDEGEEIEWKDATESAFDYSEVRTGLYEDLAARREELEKRERALSTREALLEAAERELDQKIREMNAVRNEIEGLLQEQSDEEMARVNSLVRIYESMKAKDAARIFNTLDMDVLIDVLSRMSERKSAPILAEMNPERARSVTILLAQQKQIPSIPPQ